MGKAGGVEQGLAGACVAGAPLGFAAADEQFHASWVGRVGAAGVEEVKGGGVVAGRLVVGQLRQGTVTGRAGRTRRPVPCR